MTERKLLVFTVCGFFMIAAVTSAETREGDPIRFSIDLTGQFTDNRDSVKDGESNVDIYLKPRIDAVFYGERTLVDLFYAPAYRYRSRPSEIQNDVELHHDLNVNVEHKLEPRVKVRLKERFNQTDDPTIQEGGTTLRRDSSYIMNRLKAGANYAFTRRSNVDLMGGHMMKRYDNSEVAQQSDVDQVDVRATVWRQVQRDLGLLASASFGKVGYDSSLGIKRDFTSIFGTVGMEKIINSNLRGGARLGWMVLDYDDSGLDSRSNPFLNLSLQASTIPSTRITVSINHSLKDAYVYPFASQEHTGLEFRVERDVSARIKLVFDGEYRIEDYDAKAVSDTTPDEVFLKERSGQERTFLVLVEVAYEINQSTWLKFIQLYENVDSEVAASFTRNATSLVLSRQF